MLSNDIYLGAIPWVLMQVLLVAIVIFVPQSVTMFLDKAEKIDLDKVKIEMPVEEPVPGEATMPGNSVAPAPVPAASGAMPTASEAAAADTASDKAAADEQKKIDDLFKK